MPGTLSQRKYPGNDFSLLALFFMSVAHHPLLVWLWMDGDPFCRLDLGPQVFLMVIIPFSKAVRLVGLLRTHPYLLEEGNWQL